MKPEPWSHAILAAGGLIVFLTVCTVALWS